MASFTNTEVACVLCKRSDNNKNLLGDIRTLDGVTIHYFCALFASGLYQNGNHETEGIWGFLVPDIKRESKRASRLTCAFCKKEGASVGCLVGSCRIAFHFPCGLAKNVLNQYFGSFSSYCEKHRPHQVLPKKKKRSNRDEDVCAICLCNLDPRPSVDVLLAPCCRNAYFHRQCIQEQAVASGLHFFKCPLCNNKDIFTDEMLKFGIYIPDQDASWERESNAFEELLERHNSCDINDCLCEQGRNHNGKDSCWEIMLCDCCGSQGTHLRCSNLKTMMDDWMCSPCSAVMEQVSIEQQQRENEKKLSAAPVSQERRKRVKYSTTPELLDRANHNLSEPESTRHALRDLTASVSNTSQDPAIDQSLGAYKPRPRCLSKYIQRHKTGRHLVSDESTPRWFKILLNDDIHTGRNLGVKLSYMHHDSAAYEEVTVEDKKGFENEGGVEPNEACGKSDRWSCPLS